MNQAAKNIGVFFGSRSPEHDISIITAMRVMEGFKELANYRAIAVYIGKNGKWFSGEDLGNIAFFREPRFEENLKLFSIASLSWSGASLLLYPERRLLKPARPIKIELAFPCFHGSFGEDGTIQGLFETAGVPYVGCGVLASSLTMSKAHTRRILRDAGIATVPTIEIARDSFAAGRGKALNQTAERFPFPLFVKPNALGSSIAVARVTNEQELEWALEVVFQFDTLALVEPAIANVKEVNVAIIGHENLIVSETEEPRFQSAFQTFEEKYLVKGGTLTQSKGKTKSQIPADIPGETSSALKGAAQKAFRALGASGISRFDFLINTATNEWHLGEVNTLPGSLQAHLWSASGITLPQLVQKLVNFAEERWQEERALQRTFVSSVLKK